MDVWLILDGRQAGPFSDHEIREQLRKGELDASTPAWLQGEAGWCAVGELASFRDSSAEPPQPPEPPEPILPAVDIDVASAPLGVQQPVLPIPPMPWRRFWARWFDLQWFMTVFWLTMWAS